MLMAEADRVALQHLLSAYQRESGRGQVLQASELSDSWRTVAAGRPVLVINLQRQGLTLLAPLQQISAIGPQRLAQPPQLLRGTQRIPARSEVIAALLLDDLGGAVDTVLERWLHSRSTLERAMVQRAHEVDTISDPRQGFWASEQALLAGHAMHPTPKGCVGFTKQDEMLYSPERAASCQLHIWLVDPQCAREGHAEAEPISQHFGQALRPLLSARQRRLWDAHPDWKPLPLHPWQARYLMGQPLWQDLNEAGSVVSMGAAGWQLLPTSSVRTLGGNAPWMFKPSLSVAITNSVRVNQYQEALRGELSCRLWRGPYGQRLRAAYPTLKVVNDPGWMALAAPNGIIEESLCIFRDNPFATDSSVACMASLCQDAPWGGRSRLTRTLNALARSHALSDKALALSWFEAFLEVAVNPVLTLYVEHGMAFEAHQQNTLLELVEGWPAAFWLRDNQGFYYIEEHAADILKIMPELAGTARSVGPRDFVDGRFIYYFFGNTLLGLISALAHTGHISEAELLVQLRNYLENWAQRHPCSLLERALHADTWPYKANLLTRLQDLDELRAPLENQSVYVEIPNPLRSV